MNVDSQLQERFVSAVAGAPVVDADDVVAKVRNRVVRRRRRRRVALSLGVAVAVTAVVAVAVNDDPSRQDVGVVPATAGEIDAAVMWVDESGPMLGDPGRGLAVSISPESNQWCTTCPLVRVGDAVVGALQGRVYRYDIGGQAFLDVGRGDSVFPGTDGTFYVASGRTIEERGLDGATVGGPWTIPDGYELAGPAHRTGAGVLIQPRSFPAFIRPLFEWRPTTDEVTSVGDFNQLIDTHGSLVAGTDCELDFPCWLIMHDLTTGDERRIDSPLPGNGFYGGGAFSPDGSRLAVFVATNEGSVNPAARLAIVDVATGAIDFVDNGDVAVGEPYGYASWSPSGAWVFFGPGELRAAPASGGPAQSLGLAGAYSLVALDARAAVDVRTIPDVKGLTVAAATEAAQNAGFVLGLYSPTDSEDPLATVLAQEPGPGPAVRGTGVGVRTAAPRPDPAAECPDAKTVLSGVPDALPAEGQTDLARVRMVVDRDRAALVESFGAVRAIVAHRGGHVWHDSETTLAVDDYQILVELPSPSVCPAMPHSWDGIPVAFVVSGGG